MRYRTLIAGLAGLALMAGCAPPALAATQSASTPLTYTVSVNGGWSGSWTVAPTSGSYTSKSAPAIDVPANKAYTAHGNLVVTIPALPSGYQYYGSWSMSNPGLLSNAWCGNSDAVQPTFSIPASGGTITEPLSQIWGTMPATPSGLAPCDIAISPPLVASTSGSEKSQFNTLDLALPVSIVQPKPKPSPSPSKSTSPSHSVSPSKSPSPSKTKAPVKSTSPSKAPPTPKATKSKPVVKKSPSPSPSQSPTHQPKPVASHHAVVHHKHRTIPPFPWWILVIAVVLGGTWYWVWRRRMSRQNEE